MASRRTPCPGAHMPAGKGFPAPRVTCRKPDRSTFERHRRDRVQNCKNKPLWIIGATVGASIYISPNYFGGWVELSKITCGALAFCEGSRAVWRFSCGISNTIGELTSKVPKVTCFTVHFGIAFGGGPDLPPLSRIRASWALRHGNGATRRKSRR